jgi:hypothetical protein
MFASRNQGSTRLQRLQCKNRQHLVSFCLPMGILYAISILAFSALLWAALSVARHIRHSPPVDEPAPSTPPPVPKPLAGDRPFLEPLRTEPARPAAPSQPRPFEFYDPREFKLHPTQNRQAPQPVTPPAAPQPVSELQTHDLPIHGVRRPPRKMPAQRVSDRLDWAYYNKDLGDLKDPEPSNRNSTPRSNIKQA